MIARQCVVAISGAGDRVSEPASSLDAPGSIANCLRSGVGALWLTAAVVKCYPPGFDAEVKTGITEMYTFLRFVDERFTTFVVTPSKNDPL